MKQINITFEDKEHSEIVKEKEKTKLNWRKFILSIIRKTRGV